MKGRERVVEKVVSVKVYSKFEDSERKDQEEEIGWLGSLVRWWED